jgi:BirA family biotin operon repressor/biotin-[acetyl-CoA-carboxylase] ligase
MDLDPTRLGELVPWLAGIECPAEVPSTNDLARQRRIEGRPVPLLVTAHRQSAGRGRGSHAWWSGPRGLAFSLLFDPRQMAIVPRDSPLVSLAAALAVVETLDRHVSARHGLGIRWPNDVHAGKRKLAGVLCEGLADGSLIVGIGLNVNDGLEEAPADLRPRITTVRELTGREWDRTLLLAELLGSLRDLLVLLAAESPSIAREVDRRLLQHGEILSIDTGRETTSGVCQGVADDGALRLNTAAGPRTFHGGVLRPPR